MTELLTSAQMRAVEAAAIASGAVTGLELMERAGRGVVAAVVEEWPELGAVPATERGGAGGAVEYLGQDEAKAPRRAVVLCGPGNNGGDGFVVARLLRGLGWAVEVFLYGDAARLPPDARVNHERWAAMGAVRGWVDRYPYDPWAADVIVDALFGTGLSRPVSFAEGFGAMLPEWDLRDDPRRPVVVAVDLPSGLCSDSGRCLADGDALWADLTVSFHRRKLGHVLGEGPELCGRVRVVDIGLNDVPLPKSSKGTFGATWSLYPPRSHQKDSDWLCVVTEAGEESAIGAVGRLGKRNGHKYSYGHALALSGPAGRGGAARLAARGALRIGAGVVTVGCPADAMAESAARLDAVMLREMDGAGDLAAVLEDLRINALCLGPGLGLGARAAGLVGVALGLVTGCPPPLSRPHEGEGSRLGQGAAPAVQGLPLPLVGTGEGWGARRMVLDADALTLIARDAAQFGALHEGCVLTPHVGEFARLFPDIAARLADPATSGPAYSRVDATREAAAQAGCVVLLKGPDTVIAGPDGRCAVNAAVGERAAPWLATAGSGDVLTGFICGLMARGFAPFDAACTAAWLHVECARSFGPGLIAEDLPEELPRVLRALGL
ncbi:MAG: NAD(P)H-hydrate epimerase [Paracoccaceae bacterium]